MQTKKMAGTYNCMESSQKLAVRAGALGLRSGMRQLLPSRNDRLSVPALLFPDGSMTASQARARNDRSTG